MIWRRAAVAICMSSLDPPGPEYARLSDLVTDHINERGAKKRSGYANVSCISPFEAVSYVLDWMTSVKYLPLLSILQALCLITRSGS